VKLQFDPNQQFQLDAVAAITDLFDGQPRGTPEFSVINAGEYGGMLAGQDHTELGAGNHLLLADDKLLASTRAIQLQNDIEVADPGAPLEAWELFDIPADRVRACPHFSVEMETGTGKTYVYLRTVFELCRRYGFRKFIIVVPSVAIREGVLKNIEITAEHFRALYNNLPFEHFVYDAKKINRLRQFATDNSLQILVINSDAFRKNFTGTEEERKNNVICKESDRLSGRQPIEFVQAARPIVIIDEPQSVDSTDKAQEAIKVLNPLCTLRYLATHRNPYNPVYRLDPVRAFELKLVKQIVVASAWAEGAANDALVRVEQIDYKKGIKAKLRIQAQTPHGPKEKRVTVKNGADLFVLSGERACYAQGFSVAEINAEPGAEFIRFSNGRTLRLGEETGGMRDDVWRAQIRHTVKRHLEKELQVREGGIKVLSLFFIDRVANYRDYDGAGQPLQGKFAAAFEAQPAAFAAEEALDYGNRPVSDLLAYLQNETELTRSTLVRILKESGRLGEFFDNPQGFLDRVAGVLKHELHRLLVDGIKYERIDGAGAEAEWEMLLFRNEEVINCLTALDVEKSVYEYVVYESEVERELARSLDEREDIRLFVKLPDWFKVDTPVGAYNPDWAILKHDGQALYLVRETKGTPDFPKLRTGETDKIRCGQKHFEALGMPFAVAVTANEV